MRRNTMILTVLVAIAAFIVGASAAPGNVSVDNTLNSSWSGQGDTGSFNSYGGNVTEMNLSSWQQTGSWVGFWGNLSGGVTLRDSGGNAFYEWSVTDFTDAVVYACNKTGVSFSNVVAVNTSHDDYVPTYVRDGGSDDYNQTFTSSEQFSSDSITRDDVNYTTTEGAGGYKTYFLVDKTNVVSVWAGKAIEDQTAYDGASDTDYQILAPADSAGQTYYFYLEMP